MRTTLILIAALLTIIPVATAQAPLDPLRSHADEKVAGATHDPARFATDHASEEAIAGEAGWGLAYACYVVDHAEHEYGTPDPELEQCDDYEEALGIEEEPHEELPEAIAENLTEEPVAEVEALAEDAVATAERIVDEPTSAIDEALAFFGRALGAAGRILGGAVVLVLLALGVAIDFATDLADATLAPAELLVESLGLATATTTATADQSLGAIETILATLGSNTATVADFAQGAWGVLAGFVGWAGAGIAQTTAAIGDGIADTAGAIGNALGDLIDSLLGTGSGSDDATPKVDPSDLPVATDGLLPDVGKLVDDVV